MIWERGPQSPRVVSMGNTRGLSGPRSQAGFPSLPAEIRQMVATERNIVVP